MRQQSMQQQIAIVTLGVVDLVASRRFYQEGFGWAPVFEEEAIVFYQMNGFLFGTWLLSALEEDTGLAPLPRPGAVSLSHNMPSAKDVEAALERLAHFGGKLLRPASPPPYGGLRGYIADPDGHIWEIAWNPALPISPEGYVTFPKPENE